MTEKEVLFKAVGDLLKPRGYRKRASTWFLRGPETLAVVNLQRSLYSAKYYVNVSIWLLGVEDADSPSFEACHVRTRLEGIFADRERRVEALFDLENGMDEVDRLREVRLMFEELLEILDACKTVEGLKGPVGMRLLRNSLVRGSAQPFLSVDANGVPTGS